MNMLVELAAMAETQPPPPGSGPYNYVHTTGRYLATAQTTDGQILDARLEDTDREFWVAADGSGRIEETRDGRRSRMSGNYSPGGLWPGPLAALPAGAEPLPHLRQSRAPQPVGWIRDIEAIWSVQAVPPAVQGVLLRQLATQSGLRMQETTDHAGRRGFAVSADDPPGGSRWRGRHVLVLDPGTAMLLGAEHITLQRGDLPVAVPEPDSYTCWMRTGYTPDRETRP
jgi:hypothetical protein